MKTTIGSQLQNLPEVKDTIIAINTQTDMSRHDKLEKIIDILNKLLPSTISDSNTNFLLQHIANEILNDNIENSIMNNLVTSDTFNPDEIRKRDSESLLTSIDDIQRWIKRFEIENE